MSRLLNFAMFYLGWFACVGGAAHGQLWLGPALTVVLLALHLWYVPNRRAEIALIVGTGIFGFACDTLLAASGVYAFTDTSVASWLCPPWMVALWMLFATTLNSSLAWLGRRFALGATLGAICGPLSYLAGARLGAIELSADAWVALFAIALAWAMAMPALLWFRGALTPSASRISVRAAVVTAVLMSTLSTPTVAPAAEIEGVQFSDAYRRHDVTLALNCVGLLRYKILFKGYVAGLYLGPGVTPDEALNDVPKRLELSYFWSINAADFGRVGDEILERNIDPDTLARLRPRLAQINTLYESVQPGDRYALTYVPGVGTELSLNGRSKGVIPGADFAAAYFRIWLGEQSIDASLRDQLLTCRRG